jgi:hypothetical protein
MSLSTFFTINSQKTVYWLGGTACFILLIYSLATLLIMSMIGGFVALNDTDHAVSAISMILVFAGYSLPPETESINQ